MRGRHQIDQGHFLCQELVCFRMAFFGGETTPPVDGFSMGLHNGMNMRQALRFPVQLVREPAPTQGCLV